MDPVSAGETDGKRDGGVGEPAHSGVPERTRFI